MSVLANHPERDTLLQLSCRLASELLMLSAREGATGPTTLLMKSRADMPAGKFGTAGGGFSLVFTGCPCR